MDSPLYQPHCEAPSTLPMCPLLLLISTGLFQILLSRLIRRILSEHLSSTHRFHNYCPEIKRRVTVQLCALVMKPLLLVYFLPFLHSYLHPGDSVWAHEDLEAIIALHASMYLFDITHHHATPPYFVHHILVLTCGLFIRGREPLVVLFFAPFLAGIIFGDACIEAAWLTYRLSNGVAKDLMAVFAQVNRAVRCIQWGCIVVYLMTFWRQMLKDLGWKGTVALTAACAFWAWCEQFAVRLCFGLGEKLEREVTSPEEKEECVYAALAKQKAGAPFGGIGSWVQRHMVEYVLWCIGM